MSDIHQQDIDGCVYTMEVLNQYENRITDWEHTTGEYDKCDMFWTGITSSGETIYADENKDRRWPWKTTPDGRKVRDYKHPQNYSKYPSQMFNFDKYEYLMNEYRTNGSIPLYTADYIDGVWLCNLSKLPEKLIYTDVEDGGWKSTASIAKTTMRNTEKEEQERFYIPNNYGHFFKKLND